MKNIFHRHGECFGIPLFKFGRYYIELWFCKSGYSVEEHFHQMQDNKIIFLFGSRVTFFKRFFSLENEERVLLNFKDIFKSFRIPLGCYHRFINNGKWPFVFINVARFYYNFNPISASKDFKTTI